jgi:hypothetical protein
MPHKLKVGVDGQCRHCTYLWNEQNIVDAMFDARAKVNHWTIEYASVMRWLYLREHPPAYRCARKKVELGTFVSGGFKEVTKRKNRCPHFERSYYSQLIIVTDKKRTIPEPLLDEDDWYNSKAAQELHEQWCEQLREWRVKYYENQQRRKFEL